MIRMLIAFTVCLGLVGISDLSSAGQNPPEECSPLSLQAYANDMESSLSAGDLDAAVQKALNLSNEYDKFKGCQADFSELKAEQWRTAQNLTESTLRNVTTRMYKHAKQTKKKEHFAKAEILFKGYLHLFPKSKDSYHLRFTYANLLFHRLGKPKEAAEEYTMVVLQDLSWAFMNGHFPKMGTQDDQGRPAAGTYRCDASYKAVLAYREILMEERRRERSEGNDSAATDGEKRRKEIPDSNRKFIDANQLFLSICPGWRDACEFRFDIGKTFYDYDHFHRAVSNLDKVVNVCPTSDLAERAVSLVFESIKGIKRNEFMGDDYAHKYSKNRVLMRNKRIKKLVKDNLPVTSQ